MHCYTLPKVCNESTGCSLQVADSNTCNRWDNKVRQCTTKMWAPHSKHGLHLMMWTKLHIYIKHSESHITEHAHFFTFQFHKFVHVLLTSCVRCSLVSCNRLCSVHSITDLLLMWETFPCTHVFCTQLRNQLYVKSPEKGLLKIWYSKKWPAETSDPSFVWCLCSGWENVESTATGVHSMPALTFIHWTLTTPDLRKTNKPTSWKVQVEGDIYERK